MAWNPTKRWASENWTVSDAGLYLHDNMQFLHRTHQGIVGAFANGATITNFATTLINVATCLPYTPDFNGVLEMWVVVNYVSTASGAPTQMFVNGGAGQFASTMSQFSGWFFTTITAGSNPSLFVSAEVNTGSAVVDATAIAWVAGS